MLGDLVTRREAHDLECAIANSFAFLKDHEILLITEALSGASASTALAEIVSLVGPEEQRIGPLIAAGWGPGHITDPDVAMKVLSAVATFRPRSKPTKEDAQHVVDALPLTPDEKKSTSDEFSRIAMDTIDWGVLGRILMSGAVAIATKRIPRIAYTAIPSILRGVGTAAGALYGGGKHLLEP